MDAISSVGINGLSNPNQNVSLAEGNSYKFEWCITNDECQICDTIDIVVNTNPVLTVTSSPTCAPSLLTYSYNLTVSSGVVSSEQGTISGTAPNYTISNVDSSKNDTITVVDGTCSTTLYINKPICSCPTIAAPVSSGNQAACIDSGSWPTVAVASPGLGLEIDWYVNSSGGSPISSNNLTYTPSGALTQGNFCYYAESREAVSGCVSSLRTAVCIQIDSLPLANAGNDTLFEIPVSTTENFDLSATLSGGIGTWNQFSGPSVGINGVTDASPSITVAPGNLYELEWCVENANCITCDTISIDVRTANQAPIAITDSVVTNEDTSVDIIVLSNDYDLDGILDTTSISEINAPNNGGITINPITGIVTYIPNVDFVGTDVFTYAVCDTGMPVLCDTASVYIVITSVPDTTYITTPEDTSVLVCLDTVTSFSSPIVSTSICSQASNGNIQVATTPCAEYTPDANFVGNDTACVVTCTNTVCDTTIIIIIVTPVNDPPVALNDTNITNEDTPITIDVLDNDSDIDGPLDSTSVIVTTSPTNGTATPNVTTGEIVYVPNTNFVGSDQFTYAVCDTGMPVLCDTAIVTLTIIPQIDTIYIPTPEDTPVIVCLDSLSNFEDSISSVNFCSGVNNGTIFNSSATCVEYIPNQNFNGNDTACVITCAGVLCDTTIIVIIVTPVNDPPIAINDNENTREDTPVDIIVTTNDSDPDGQIDVTSVSEVSAPNNGSIVVNPVTGVVSYTPDADFIATDVFTYAVCDTGMPILCDTALVTVIVTPAPDTTYITVPEDSVVRVCTDSIVNLGGLTITNISLCGAPENGTLGYNPLMLTCIDYFPNPNYVGQDTICLLTCSNGLCDTTIVVVTVTPVNDPPIAIDDNENTREDTPVDIIVTTNDSDPDGQIDVTSVSEVSAPNNGSVIINPVTGVVTYTPNTDFIGTDVFTYAVCDTGMPILCDTAVVSIDVLPRPDTTYITVPEDSVVRVCTDSLVNFGGLIITNISLCGAPENGALGYNPLTLTCIDYSPNTDYIGQDTVCLLTCSNGLCDTTIIIITVTPVNDPPIAVNDRETTPEETPVTVEVLNNDRDLEGPLDSTSVVVVTQPINGAATSNPVTGEVVYTPNTDFVGTDVFTYAVCDTGLPVLCDTAIVTITVTPVTDTIYVPTPEDTPVVVCMDSVTNFTNPIVSTSLCGQGSNGTIRSVSLPCVEYTPNNNYVGNDTTCIVTCTNTVCDTTIIVIIVTPVNDPPIAVNDRETTPEETPVTVEVLNNDRDLEGPLDSTSVIVVTQPVNGAATSNPITGEVVYTPNVDFVGTDVFTYAVCDTGIPVLCDTAIVTITVTPVADTTRVITPEETPITVCLDSLSNIGSITSVSFCKQPDYGTLDNTSSLPCVIYTPNLNYVGEDSTCLIVCSGVVCDTTYIYITVTPVNDPPIAVNDSETTPEERPISVDVLNNDRDLEGPLDSTSVVVVTQPINGTATPDPLTGEVVYTPDTDFVGTDVFTYAVCDTGLPVLCDTAIVIITVTPVTDTIYVPTPEDTPVVVCMDSVSNFTNPIVSTSLCGQGSNGTIRSVSLPCVEYTPNNNYVGNDTTCIVTCTNTVCDTTIIVIIVTPVNDPPIAVNDAETTLEDIPVIVDVLNNDSDLEGPLDSTSVIVVTPPLNGTTTPDPVTGEVVYTPNAEFVGTDVFTYAVCDTGLPVLCDTAIVIITVTPVTDTIYVPTPEDTPVVVCMDSVSNFTNPIVSTSLCGQGSNGTIRSVSLPCVEYTPNNNYVGNDTTCIVTCTNTVCDTTIIVIIVTPVNDPPIAVNDAETTLEDIPVIVDVLNNDSDLEGPLDSTSVIVVTPPLNGTATPDPVTGEVVYTPNAEFVGTDVFTYAVCDTGLPVLCDTAIVSITITSVADTIPVVTTPEDTPVIVCMDSIINFANPITSISFCATPINGSINPTLLPCIIYTPNDDFYGNDTACIVVCSGTICDTVVIPFTVTPIIDDILINPVSNICETSATPTISATTEVLTTISWFNSNGVNVGVGNTIIPPVTIGENCFYAVAEHDTIPGLFSDTAVVCFTVDSLPAFVSAGLDSTICGFHDYELQGTGNGQNNFWTQLVGSTVSLDFSNPNAIVSLEPNNAPGSSNTYTFRWTNINGLCRVSDDVSISVTNPHLTNAGNDTTVCLPQSSGSIQLNATLSPAGTGLWVYSGGGNVTFADATDPNTTVSGLVPYLNPTSTYRFYWYETIGDCVARDEVLVLVNESAEIVGLANADTTCLGSPIVLEADITSIKLATYSWRRNSPTGVAISFDGDALVSPTQNTTYYVVASVDFGPNICRTIDSIDITVDGAPIAQNDGCYELFEDNSYVGNTSDWSVNDDYSNVLNGEVEFVVIESSTLNPASSLTINNTTGSFTYSPALNMNGFDTATVGVFNAECPDLMSTFFVCFNVKSEADLDIIAVNDSSEAIANESTEISLFPNDTLNNNSILTIVTILTNPINGTVDVISNENGIVNYTSTTDIAQIDSFQYIVCQYLVDGESLCDTAWVYVYVDGVLDIPEGFTPNGDGINDGFEIPNLLELYPKASLKIFNR